MNLREWWDHWRGQPPYETDLEAQIVLTETQHAQAGRLAKLTGSTRDEVLRQAYRESDAMLKRK